MNPICCSRRKLRFVSPNRCWRFCQWSEMCANNPLLARSSLDSLIDVSRNCFVNKWPKQKIPFTSTFFPRSFISPRLLARHWKCQTVRRPKFVIFRSSYSSKKILILLRPRGRASTDGKLGLKIETLDLWEQISIWAPSRSWRSEIKVAYLARKVIKSLDQKPKGGAKRA